MNVLFIGCDTGMLQVAANIAADAIKGEKHNVVVEVTTRQGTEKDTFWYVPKTHLFDVMRKKTQYTIRYIGEKP